MVEYCVRGTLPFLAADIWAQLQAVRGQRGVAEGHRAAGLRTVLFQQPRSLAQRGLAQGMRGPRGRLHHVPFVNSLMLDLLADPPDLQRVMMTS